MRQRPHTEVVAALRLLKCHVLVETRDATIICRGATKLANVPVGDSLPVVVQRQILNKLDFSEAEFLKALCDVN